MKTIKEALPKVAVLAMALGLSSTVNAHLIGIGYIDNGDGSVDIFGEHWHGDLGSPSDDTWGLYVLSGPNNVGTWYDWTGNVNNVTLASFSPEDTSYPNPFQPIDTYQDFLTVTIAGLTSGTYTFGTGTCGGLGADGITPGGHCADANDGIGTYTVTLDIPTGVPEPATASLLGLGLIGLAALRNRKSNIIGKAGDLRG